MYIKYGKKGKHSIIPEGYRLVKRDSLLQKDDLLISIADGSWDRAGEDVADMKSSIEDSYFYAAIRKENVLSMRIDSQERKEHLAELLPVGNYQIIVDDASGKITYQLLPDKES